MNSTEWKIAGPRSGSGLRLIVMIALALAAPIASAETWRLTITGDGVYLDTDNGPVSTGPATATVVYDTSDATLVGSPGGRRWNLGTPSEWTISTGLPSLEVESLDYFSMYSTQFNFGNALQWNGQTSFPNPLPVDFTVAHALFLDEIANNPNFVLANGWAAWSIPGSGADIFFVENAQLTFTPVGQGIVYVDLEPDIVLLSDGSGQASTALDIDGDASYDLTLTHVYDVSTNRFAARGQRAGGGGAAYMRSGEFIMRRLSAGDVIGPAGTFHNSQADLSLADDFNTRPSEFEHPDTAQEGFIGFRLGSGSYGWIEVEVAPDNAGLQRYQLTIKGYAYDADGDPIVAGETPDSDGDGISDAIDNCPDTFNPDQLDSEVPSAALIPLGTWRFEEGAGVTAVDPIGDHDATLYGATRMTGRYGDGVWLNGTSDYIAAPASPQLETTDGTITAWIRPMWTPAGSGENPMIMGLRESGATRYSLHVRRNYGRIDIYNGSAVYSFIGAVPQDEWSHVAVSVGSGTVKCYLNGVQIDGDRSGGFGTQTGLDLSIGSNGSGEFFQGAIDEVAIFGRALTAAEIADIATIGLGDGVGDACDACSVTNLTRGIEYQTIRQAVDASVSGDVIELGACTFIERSILVSGKDLTIRGQGPDLTIIDGDGEVGSIFKFAAGSTSTMENLTLRNGVANEIEGGGAAFIRQGSDLVFRNCRFEGNDSGGFLHGAVNVIESTTSAFFERCEFRNNTTVNNGNASAVGTVQGRASFVDCLFEGDESGLSVLYFQSGALGAVVNCTFADFVGGRFIRAGLANAHVDVVNSVFDSSAVPLLAFSGATSTITRCLYAGATGDNIDGPPTFVDAANGDYRLAPGSLGIDAADYDFYLTALGGASDLAGAPRTVDSCIDDTGLGVISYLDVGAYETQDDGTDTDGDGVGDVCDVCPDFDDNVDTNGNGVPDGCETACLGDINDDGAVDLSDLAGLLSHFGMIGVGLDGDLDNDGDVDLSDLAGLLSQFGVICN